MKLFILGCSLILLSVSEAYSGTVDTAQRLLNQLGYNAGVIDGLYGGKTRRALEEFYADNGSSFDGKLDANEVADLKAATIAARLDVGDKNSVGGRMPGAGTVAVKNPFQAGAIYPHKYKINGKYYLPIWASADGGQGDSWTAQLDNWLNDFYRIGDFNRDGVLDWFITAQSTQPDGFAEALAGHQSRNMSQDNNGGAFMCDTKYGACEGDKHPYDIITTDNGIVGYPRFNKFKQHVKTAELISDDIPFFQNGSHPTVVADFNGDGWDDMYLGSAQRGINGTMDGGYHSYFLSQPGGGLVESSRTHIRGAEFNKKMGRIEDFSHRVDAGDLDGDGDIDILLTSWDWVGGKNGNGKVTCLWNDGRGKLTSKTCGDQFGMNIKHGDFNGDGHIDLIMGNVARECAKFYPKYDNNGKKRMAMRVAFGDGSGKWTYKRSVTIKDFGSHQHRSDVNIPLCSMPTSLVWDFDNDGDLDMLGNAVGYNYTAGYWVLLENDGYGNFSIKHQVAAGGDDEHIPYNWTKRSHFPKAEIGHGTSQYCTSPILLDLNGDGFMDFYCTTHEGSPTHNIVWINEQGNSFRKATGPELFKYAKVY